MEKDFNEDDDYDNEDEEDNLKELLEIQEKKHKRRVEDLKLRNGKTFEEAIKEFNRKENGRKNI